MKEENQMTEQESLSIIHQMISTAKNEQKDDGKGWILWGWLLFLASVFTILNMRFSLFKDTFLFWNAFGLITVAYFAYKAVVFFFFRKTVATRTYTGDLFAKLNVGFFISLFLIIMAANVGGRLLDDIVPVSIGFAMLISLYAFWALIYGSALNFRPSVIGAYLAWALSFAALLNARNFEMVMGLHALAVLAGYIIPGHLANREFNKMRKTKA